MTDIDKVQLEAGQMHRLVAPTPFALWHVDLRHGAPVAQVALLSTGELDRAARFVFERDRHRYVVAHIALRLRLAMHTGLLPEQINYLEGPFGKPALQGKEWCSFNMSHSEDVAWIALADDAAIDSEIGVDVEMLRPMDDALPLARQNFSTAEIAELLATPADQQSLAFLLGWTRKEACLKAIGSGLSIAPNIFTVGLTTAPCSTVIDTPQGPRRVHVESIRHGDDVVGALARVEPGSA
jgi:4'-phosphopantetheinyl transferase